MNAANALFSPKLQQEPAYIKIYVQCLLALTERKLVALLVSHIYMNTTVAHCIALPTRHIHAYSGNTLGSELTQC